MRRDPPAEAKIIYNTGLSTKNKDELKHSIRQYQPMRSELAMIDDIVMKGKKIILFLFQAQIIQQLHINHMGIKKMERQYYMRHHTSPDRCWC